MGYFRECFIFAFGKNCEIIKREYIFNEVFFSMGICKNAKLKNTKPNHIEKKQNFKPAKLKGFTVH